MTYQKLASDSTNKLKIQLLRYYNLSIDRIDNEKGYLKENIQITTMGYNKIKGQLEEKYLYEIAKSIISYDGTPGNVKISYNIERFIKAKLDKVMLRKPSKTGRVVECDITAEDLYQKFVQQGGLCNLSGKVMNININKKESLKGRQVRKPINFLNISIDRIDSTAHYTIDNVQLVCSCINLMKWEMSQTTFIEFCEAIAKTNPV